MKSNKLLTQQQEQEHIPSEVIGKFDNDEQLVREFMKEGYTIEELKMSTVTHPTKYDPICILEDGRTAGMWLDGGKKYLDNSRTYQNRRNRFF
jgi:hypothetical protein